MIVACIGRSLFKTAQAKNIFVAKCWKVGVREKIGQMGTYRIRVQQHDFVSFRPVKDRKLGFRVESADLSA